MAPTMINAPPVAHGGIDAMMGAKKKVNKGIQDKFLIQLHGNVHMRYTQPNSVCGLQFYRKLVPKAEEKTFAKRNGVNILLSCTSHKKGEIFFCSKLFKRQKSYEVSKKDMYVCVQVNAKRIRILYSYT